MRFPKASTSAPIFVATPEARVDGEPFAEFGWQIAPGRASAGNPQNRLHKQSIVLRALSRIAQLSRQFPFNARISFVVQTCPNQSWLPSLPALNQIFPSEGILIVNRP